jgi:chromosome partitioning protein
VRTIAIVNQKGGCGKTTTAINLAALYARRGLRTLLVDMDPQSHCAAGLGVPEARIERTVGQAMLADHSRGFDPAALVWEVSRNLWLAPSTMSLAALEAPGGGLHAMPDKDRRLESLLNALASHYDRCLIDCAPTVGLLTFNALRACRETLIPVETGFFALRGAEKQWNTIQRLIERIARPIACHMLATLHNPESRLAVNILSALWREFAGQIMPVVIREHEVLREAASFGQPVLEYAPDSEACRDFEALADWLEEHHARPTSQIEVLPAAGAMPMGMPLPGPMSMSAIPGAMTASIPPDPVATLSGGAETAALAGMMPSVSPPASPPGPSRAAELARRVSDLLARSRAPLAPASTAAALPTASYSTPGITEAEARSLTGMVVADAPEPPAPKPAQPNTAQANAIPGASQALASSPSIARLFGVRPTSRGVLFVQPFDNARSIAIAGDFNQWSADTHSMRRNDEAGVFERIIELPPGTHHYRLVIDGRWMADPHNPAQARNSFGEINSFVEVPVPASACVPLPAAHIAPTEPPVIETLSQNAGMPAP